jgi:hypothetical protein
MSELRKQPTSLQDQDVKQVVLRGLALVPLFYLIVQVVQLIAGDPLVWFSQVHFIVAIFMPAVIVVGNLIVNRRAHARAERE